MSSMKRVRPVVLVLILAGLLVASPALAGKVADASCTTFKLFPPAGAPEPKASGQWILRHDSGSLTEYVTVRCKGLTPGKQYAVVVLVDWTQWVRSGYDVWPIDSGSYSIELAVTADARGRLNAQFTVESEWSWTGGVDRSVQDVWIENDEGNVVLE